MRRFHFKICQNSCTFFNFVQKIVANASKDVRSCQFLLIRDKARVSPRPLQLASRRGLKRAVQELLSQGASAQEMDDKGMFDLHPSTSRMLLDINVFLCSSVYSGSEFPRIELPLGSRYLELSHPLQQRCFVTLTE